MGLGAVLILLGLGGYVSTGREHPTALIPAYFGAAFFALGWLGRNDRLRKHVMHAAAALALIGFLVPGIMAVPKLVKLASGNEVERPRAVVLQAVMAVLCGVFVGLCVRSFITARKARLAKGP
jgi:hypothetical protein